MTDPRRISHGCVSACAVVGVWKTVVVVVVFVSVVVKSAGGAQGVSVLVSVMTNGRPGIVSFGWMAGQQFEHNDIGQKPTLSRQGWAVGE